MIGIPSTSEHFARDGDFIEQCLIDIGCYSTIEDIRSSHESKLSHDLSIVRDYIIGIEDVDRAPPLNVSDMCNHPFSDRASLLYGAPGTGKSTICDMLMGIDIDKIQCIRNVYAKYEHNDLMAGAANVEIQIVLSKLVQLINSLCVQGVAVPPVVGCFPLSVKNGVQYSYGCYVNGIHNSIELAKLSARRRGDAVQNYVACGEVGLSIEDGLPFWLHACTFSDRFRWGRRNVIITDAGLTNSVTDNTPCVIRSLDLFNAPEQTVRQPHYTSSIFDKRGRVIATGSPHHMTINFGFDVTAYFLGVKYITSFVRDLSTKSIIPNWVDAGYGLPFLCDNYTAEARRLAIWTACKLDLTVANVMLHDPYSHRDIRLDDVMSDVALFNRLSVTGVFRGLARQIFVGLPPCGHLFWLANHSATALHCGLLYLFLDVTGCVRVQKGHSLCADLYVMSTYDVPYLECALEDMKYQVDLFPSRFTFSDGSHSVSEYLTTLSFLLRESKVDTKSGFTYHLRSSSLDLLSFDIINELLGLLGRKAGVSLYELSAMCPNLVGLYNTWVGGLSLTSISAMMENLGWSRGQSVTDLAVSSFSPINTDSLRLRSMQDVDVCATDKTVVCVQESSSDRVGLLVSAGAIAKIANWSEHMCYHILRRLMPRADANPLDSIVIDEKKHGIGFAMTLPTVDVFRVRKCMILNGYRVVADDGSKVTIARSGAALIDILSRFLQRLMLNRLVMPLFDPHDAALNAKSWTRSKWSIQSPSRKYCIEDGDRPSNGFLVLISGSKISGKTTMMLPYETAASESSAVAATYSEKKNPTNIKRHIYSVIDENTV